MRARRRIRKPCLKVPDVFKSSPNPKPTVSSSETFSASFPWLAVPQDKSRSGALPPAIARLLPGSRAVILDHTTLPSAITTAGKRGPCGESTPLSTWRKELIRLLPAEHCAPVAREADSFQRGARSLYACYFGSRSAMCPCDRLHPWREPAKQDTLNKAGQRG